MGIEQQNIAGKPFYIVSRHLQETQETGATTIVPEPSQVLETSITRLLNEARTCALLRIDQNSPIAELRVTNAIENTLRPFVEEDLVIAEQIDSERYRKHVEEISDFLDCEIAADLCPDGRVHGQAVADARVLSIGRVPMGHPKTRRSSGGAHEYVIDDPDKAASIAIKIKMRLSEGKNPEHVQFGGIHIDSHDPLHGCGAAKNAILEAGEILETTMADGGLRFYFNKFGEFLTAVENNAKNAGGKATFVDMVHDAHYESLIFGLKDALENPDNYDPALTLEQNLDNLYDKKQILMTTKLDEIFRDRIKAAASKMDIEKLDSKDPKSFQDTTIALGKIAKLLAQQEESSGYSWIPETVREGKSEATLRAIAYVAIRNTAYRLLCDIRPGEHDLIDHSEELMVVGPTSPTYQRRSIPFVLKTPRGPLQEDSVKTTKTLFGMFGGFVARRKDLESEARIILVTGEHTPELYSSQENSDAELTRTLMTVMDNAALLREEYEQSVQEGRTLILSAILHPGTRKFLAIR